VTTTAISLPLPPALDAPSTIELRPRFEGCNITTWIGFKHVNYLVIEAVLAHFRTAGLGTRALYERRGLGLEVTQLDTRIATALHADDLVTATVTPEPRAVGGGLTAAIALRVERAGQTTTAATATAHVVLRREDDVAPPAPIPPEGQGLVVTRVGSGGDGRPLTATPVLEELTASANAFGWKWRIPYFYCHHSRRLGMSGYLRLMEEAVDLFLADRGISIDALLRDRDWIPVVPRSEIRVLDEALMEEDLYTVLTVEEVFKDLTYTARMDCYVARDGTLHQTATGTITHGYALIEGPGRWGLVNFDDRVLDALRGGGGPA
jgi:acyl-CoA thioesterase FadM